MAHVFITGSSDGEGLPVPGQEFGDAASTPFSARRSAQTLRIVRDLDWPTGLGRR